MSMFDGIATFMDNTNLLASPFGTYLGTTLFVLVIAFGFGILLSKQQHNLWTGILIGFMIIINMIQIKNATILNVIILFIVVLKNMTAFKNIGESIKGVYDSGSSALGKIFKRD